jgi:aspartate aminotransferase-like enzyme
LQEYTTRTTPQSGWAQNLAGFEATEEEYRALNQLHATTPTNQMSQFDAQAQAILGEERFAVFQRGQDQRFAELLSLAGRCQLPTNTVELLYQQRVIAEQQRAQVLSNPALSAEERRTLLLMVQSETRQQLFSVLGETAGEAYLRHDGKWLEAMDKGNQP